MTTATQTAERTAAATENDIIAKLNENAKREAAKGESPVDQVDKAISDAQKQSAADTKRQKPKPLTKKEVVKAVAGLSIELERKNLLKAVRQLKLKMAGSEYLGENITISANAGGTWISKEFGGNFMRIRVSAKPCAAVTLATYSYGFLKAVMGIKDERIMLKRQADKLISVSGTRTDLSHTISSSKDTCYTIEKPKKMVTVETAPIKRALDKAMEFVGCEARHNIDKVYFEFMTDRLEVMSTNGRRAVEVLLNGIVINTEHSHLIMDKSQCFMLQSFLSKHEFADIGIIFHEKQDKDDNDAVIFVGRGGSDTIQIIAKPKHKHDAYAEKSMMTYREGYKATLNTGIAKEALGSLISVYERESYTKATLEFTKDEVTFSVGKDGKSGVMSSVTMKCRNNGEDRTVEYNAAMLNGIFQRIPEHEFAMDILKDYPNSIRGISPIEKLDEQTRYIIMPVVSAVGD